MHITQKKFKFEHGEKLHNFVYTVRYKWFYCLYEGTLLDSAFGVGDAVATPSKNFVGQN